MAKICVPLFPYMEEDKFGYIDVNGQVVIPAQYDETYPFSEGLGIVRIKDRYGYVDHNGDMVLPAIFSKAENFSCGLAFVSRDKGKGSWYGYIDRSGCEVFEASFDPYHNGFSEGLLPVSTWDGKWGAVDTSGELVVPFTFDLISGDYLDDMVVADLDGRRGVVDRQGQWLVEPSFSELRILGEDRILFKREEETGLLSLDGKEISVPGVLYVGNFRGGYALTTLADHRSYMIDRNGKIVFGPATLDEKASIPQWFSEGLIGVETESETIFLNKNFEEQFRLSAATLESEFEIGLARVRFNEAPGGWGYVNRHGEIVWRCSGHYEFRLAELVELGPDSYRWLPLVERWEDLSEGQQVINPKEKWTSRQRIKHDLVVKADREGLLKLSWWFKKLAYTTIIGDSLEPSVGSPFDNPELMVEMLDEYYTAMEDLED